MSTPLRLALFAVGLLAVVGAAAGVGQLTGPVGPVGPEDADDGRTVVHPAPAHDDGHDEGADDGHDHGDAADEQALPAGLASSQDGYTLELEQPALYPGTRELRFRVVDDAGTAVTAYDEQHEKLLHLVAVRRDFTGFQHVHPTLGDDGTWRVPLALTPGSWRVYADFAAAGVEPLVLATDLSVAGRTVLPSMPPPTTTASVDGYTVTLDGHLHAGEHSMLGLTVTRGGAPVTDLEPYLGAYGHLVALREGDLAYLHVHPEEGGPAGPTIEFGTEPPSAGRYRLFLDFQHDGVVRTVSFVVEVGRGHAH